LIRRSSRISLAVGAVEDPLAELTQREREVLGLGAEGVSNCALAARLFITDPTVEAHMKQILLKLRLAANPESHRRVLAYLSTAQTSLCHCG
jgi:DNA-binding NarL/FixJ family response regulator